MPTQSRSSFQVGGSLRADDPNYVTRQADEQLYTALREGEFCYVLNSRQVGKSSLRVRVKSRLEAEGYRCAAIDMTSIGSETMTAPQWYKGLVAELWRGFNFGAIRPFKLWWQEQADTASVQVLRNFIEEVLFVQIPTQIVIFIDEIDSTIDLPFPVSDFFALIRFCYDHRSDDPTFERLTFALFGVATPADLIRSQTRTPFNIGRAIDLSGFSLQEALPLSMELGVGLGNPARNPVALLEAILAWTGGQPFLTQKLCQMVAEQVQQPSQTGVEPTPSSDQTKSDQTEPDQTKAQLVKAQLVKEQFVKEQFVKEEFFEQQFVEQLIAATFGADWKRYDQPEHLRTIRDRLLADETRSGRLLGIYQQLLNGAQIRTDDSRDQMELLLSGLVVKQSGHLRIKCRLYQAVLDQDWVQRHLHTLRPYAQAIHAWELDPEDESRLLRGRALADAQVWAEDKSLSDLDYRFLAASEALDRQGVEESLQLARAQEIAKRLEQEETSNRQQRRLITALSGLLLAAVGLAGLAFISYQRSVQSEEATAMAAINAQVASSQALFGSNQRLDALVAALQAKRQLESLPSAPEQLTETVDSALRQSVYRAVEQNRWQQGAELRGVDIRTDGQRVVAVDINGTINVWQPDGRRLASFKEEGGVDGLFGVKFSPNREEIVTASGNGAVQLWNLQGKLRWRAPGHSGAAYTVTFSPDGERIASGGADQRVKIWNRQGQLLQTLQGHQGEVWGVAFSPDGQLIASGSRDNTVKLWRSDGTLLKTLTGYRGAVRAVTFSPDSQTLVTGSDDNTVRLWDRSGQLITAYRAHDDAIEAVAYAANGRYFVTASWDKTLRVWSPEGLLLRQLQGHQDRVWTVAITPDTHAIISGSWDQTIRLWQLRNTLTTPLLGHTAAVIAVALSPNGQAIASASDDRTIRLWAGDGTPKMVVRGHKGEVYGVAFSPDGRYLASSSLDKTLKLWDWRSGKPLRTFIGHQADIWGVAFSPNSKRLASASHDRTARLWDVQTGRLLQVFRGHLSRVQRVAFSPNGQTLATVSSDGTGRLWNLSGQTLAVFRGHTAGVLGVGFSPDGQTLATASMDRTIKLWRLDGQLLRTLTGHRAEIYDVQFRPDGQMLASASSDGSIRLWQPNGTLVSTLEGHQGRVWRLAWSPDGQRIISGGEDKLVLIWNLARAQSLSQVETFACSWLDNFLRTSPLLTPLDRQLCQP